MEGTAATIGGFAAVAVADAAADEEDARSETVEGAPSGEGTDGLLRRDPAAGAAPKANLGAADRRGKIVDCGTEQLVSMLQEEVRGGMQNEGMEKGTGLEKTT